MHETQGDVSVRDQLCTMIFFPLNKHLQTAQATSHLFVSPQENLTLPPACLTGTNLLPFVGLTDTHTQPTSVLHLLFSLLLLLRNLKKTYRSQSSSHYASQSKEKKVPPPPDFTVLHHQANTNTSSLLANKSPRLSQTSRLHNQCPRTPSTFTV